MMHLLFLIWWRIILKVRFLYFMIINWRSFNWIYIALRTFFLIIILDINLIIVEANSTLRIFIHSSYSSWAMSNILPILLRYNSWITAVTVVGNTPFSYQLNLSYFIINSFISIKNSVFQKSQTVSQFFYQM